MEGNERSNHCVLCPLMYIVNVLILVTTRWLLVLSQMHLFWLSDDVIDSTFRFVMKARLNTPSKQAVNARPTHIIIDMKYVKNLVRERPQIT